MTGTPASINVANNLEQALDLIVHALRDTPWGECACIGTPLGTHGVTYHEDMTEGPYAVVGMVLGSAAANVPIYVETEDGYAVQEGFRIYQEDLA